MSTVTYSVETLRSGQPRAYADTLREYLITVKREQYGKDGMHPWVLHGDVEAKIKRDEAARKAKTMFGGYSPEQLRAAQQEWAKKIIRALCQNFREEGDDDGREGMEAHFYPTLNSLVVNHNAGTIKVLIIEPFTD